MSQRDLVDYRPMFALYLDIQKQLDIEDLNEKELRGRWKSFCNKWYGRVHFLGLVTFPEHSSV